MQQELTIYNNREPLILDIETEKKVHRLLTYIEQSVSFFHHRITNEPNMTDVHTHMGLLESYLNELSPLVQYNSVLKEEYEKRYAEIKAKNTEIHRLHQLIGNGISPESISSKLRTYDDIIRLWYGAHGFHYASLKQYTAYGIHYEFSGELQYDQDDGCSSRKEWQDCFCQSFACIANKETKSKDYDIYYDTYHAELLDTDRSKQQIQKLLKENFPNSHILQFKSRENDFASYTLRFLVNIPYEDIDRLAKHVIPGYQ